MSLSRIRRSVVWSSIYSRILQLLPKTSVLYGNDYVILTIILLKGYESNILIILEFHVLFKNNKKNQSTGEKGKGLLGKPLHYKGTKFHRVIPGNY